MTTATARAVGITRPGGPDVLEVIERDVREAGPGEVRLAVRAAAVNPTDIGVRERGIEGLPPPWVPGMDAAGVVESVGPDVEHVAVGDEVMAALSPRRPEGGGQAELVVVPAASVVAVPDDATLEGGGDVADERADRAARPRAARPPQGADARGRRRGPACSRPT